MSYEATWMLDVYCGNGTFVCGVLEEARARGRRLEIVALDEDDATIALARAHAGDDPLLRFVRAEARLLPFPDNAFDVSTCAFSLHRFEPPDVIDVLREMRRVSRVTPLVCDYERSRFGAAIVTAYACFDRGALNPAHSVKRSFTMGELLEFAGLAGWRAPSARRSGFCSIVMSDGE
jgi:ubiquinone/menaquinone biosynthesis C-methylase UbiE